MKWLIAFLIAMPALAQTQLNCVGTTSSYEVDAILNQDSVGVMTFARNGTVFREFSDISYTEKFFNVPFSTTDRLYYKFNFKQKAINLDISRKVINGVPSDTASGKLLPRNNIFTPDYDVTCTFEEL